MQYKKAKEYILERMQNELPTNSYYHSLEHTKDVLQAAKVLSAEEQVEDDDLLLLKTAVVYHDSGFIVKGKDHEKESCKIARETLPAFDYTDSDIEVICGIIMATKIPQRPNTHLEKIICDADLDYLGRDDYDPISNLLLKEMQAERNISHKEWLDIQIRFMKSHTYYTASAKKKREKKKQLNLQKLEQEYLNV
ncbi:MAG: HD domain-containing protein [Chitinophagales bacterium]